MAALALALAVVPVASACGDRPGRSVSAPANPRPCDTLSPAEVKRLMNFPPEVEVKGTIVYAVTHLYVPGMVECLWSPENATGSLVVGVAVGLAREAYSKRTRGSDEPDKIRPVRGLGQEAVWASGEPGSLIVLDEPVVVGVKPHAFGDTEATSLERAKLIAARILERMGRR